MNYKVKSKLALTFDFSSAIEEIIEITKSRDEHKRDLEYYNNELATALSKLPKQIVELYEAEEIINKLKGE